MLEIRLFVYLGLILIMYLEGFVNFMIKVKINV